MKTKSVIVIGAGIGGIVAATHLAQRGFNVTVVEKNARPGGRCDHLIRDGHHFDTGPTLLVMPLLYDLEFQALGKSFREMVDLQRVDPTYRLVFDDGSQLSLTSDMKSLEQQLETFEKGSFQGLLRYLAEGGRHYHLGIDKLVNRDFRKMTDFFRLEHIPLLYQVKPFANHYRNVSTYFHDPRLRSAFTFQDVYMGLSPFEAPATFSLMPYSELAHGVWYPVGGMIRIVDALMKLALQAGVEFRYRSPVKRIDVNCKVANGVLLENDNYLDADIVLANADLPYVYQDLLPQDGVSKRLARKEFSCSTLSFFWGVDKVYENIGPHTLFLADDYRGNFQSIMRDFDLPADPSLYMHAPARLDAGMSPPGEDTLIAVVPAGHINDGNHQDWADISNRARQQIFSRLAKFGISDLEQHIKFEMCFTPLSWKKRYNLLKGATHGLSHTLTQLAYFRPQNRHARYRNLYFVGASTRPGTGLPNAMISGRHVANRIMDELQN